MGRYSTNACAENTNTQARNICAQLPPSVIFFFASSRCVLRRNQAADLALVISRMQTSADRVEKDILSAEELLVVV